MTVREAIKKYKTDGLWSKKDIAAAEEKVRPDEEVLWAGYLSAAYGGTSSMAGTLVLTDKRIFFIKRSLGELAEYSFPIKEIVRATYVVEGILPRYEIVSYGRWMKIRADESRIRPLIDMMERLLEEEREKKRTVVEKPAAEKPEHSEADELLKWKDLLDQGIITQAEFDAKKRQLLGL